MALLIAVALVFGEPKDESGKNEAECEAGDAMEGGLEEVAIFG